MKQIFYLFAVTLLFASCNTANNKSTEANDACTKNKAVAQRFYDDVFNKHNVAALDSLMSPQYVEHTPDPGMEPTLDGLKKSFTGFFAAFPDVNCKTNLMTCEGDLVTCQVTITGTNTGPMMDVPATNKKMNVDGVDIVRIKDGKCVEHWGYFEERKMMEQMGMMPDMKNKDDKDMNKETKKEPAKPHKHKKK